MKVKVGKCRNCRFWDTHNSKIRYARCHRYAPTPQGRLEWMTTKFNDWCGDFELKKEELQGETERGEETRSKSEIKKVILMLEGYKKLYRHDIANFILTANLTDKISALRWVIYEYEGRDLILRGGVNE